METSIILIHLQMQRDVWLDNVINLRQYILGYTVGNPTSLRKVGFQWLTSENELQSKLPHVKTSPSQNVPELVKTSPW